MAGVPFDTPPSQGLEWTLGWPQYPAVSEGVRLGSGLAGVGTAAFAT